MTTTSDGKLHIEELAECKRFADIVGCVGSDDNTGRELAICRPALFSSQTC